MGHSNGRLTTTLLLGGAVAGPVFILVAYIQGLTRTGFSMTDHPASMLSLGNLGWIQITNFVIAGLLFIGLAIGMRRALQDGRGATWGPRLIAIFGVSLIAGGVFVADPALGFPPGAPEGQAASMSWHGILHAVAPAVGFPALIIACFVFARRFATVQQRGWAIYSLATGATFLVLSQLPLMTDNFLWLWIAVIIGFSWPSLIAMHLVRQRMNVTRTVNTETPASSRHAGVRMTGP